MPSIYALYIRHEVYRVMTDVSRVARTQIVAFVESLVVDPFQSGDYSESDVTGRPNRVKIIGKYALYFWVDHAVKEVRIIDLIDADLT